MNKNYYTLACIKMKYCIDVQSVTVKNKGFIHFVFAVYLPRTESNFTT